MIVSTRSSNPLVKHSSSEVDQQSTIEDRLINTCIFIDPQHEASGALINTSDGSDSIRRSYSWWFFFNEMIWGTSRFCYKIPRFCGIFVLLTHSSGVFTCPLSLGISTTSV